SVAFGTRTATSSRSSRRSRTRPSRPRSRRSREAAVVSGWSDFAVVMGAATAALLGLLFVAVSIRVETIARSAELRSRCGQTLTLLLTGLLVAALLAVPGQHDWTLGAEYLVLAVVVTVVAVALDRRAGSERRSMIGRRLDSINPTFVTC